MAALPVSLWSLPDEVLAGVLGAGFAVAGQGEGELMPSAPDAARSARTLHQIVRLRLVCRRFRRVVDEMVMPAVPLLCVWLRQAQAQAQAQSHVTLADIQAQALEAVRKWSTHTAVKQRRSVVFTHGSALVDSAIVRSLCSMRSVQCLSLAQCQRFTSCDLQNAGHLRVLDLSGCRQIHDENFNHIGVTTLKNLEHLRLSWCASLGNSALTTIAEYCLQLCSLDVTGCELVSDTGVIAVIRSSAASSGRLQNLGLAFCGIGDSTLLAIGRVRPRGLKRLTLARKVENLWSCGTWTAEGTTFLSACCPSLSLQFV